MAKTVARNASGAYPSQRALYACVPPVRLSTRGCKPNGERRQRKSNVGAKRVRHLGCFRAVRPALRCAPHNMSDLGGIEGWHDEVKTASIEDVQVQRDVDHT